MANRENRKNIAEDTLAILDKGYYENSKGETIKLTELQEKSKSLTKVYSPAMSDQLLATLDLDNINSTTEITVAHQSTLAAVLELIAQGHKDTLCLNFASAKNPGGGFLGGSQAQEESLARSTGLYGCQLKASEYYETNRNTKSCVYTDYMIYSPFVPIIKNDAGQYLDEITYCGIITAPAVNTGIVSQREPDRLGEVEDIMKRRIKKVLAIALENKHSVIVLGAWGCGVFRNNPIDIASYFHEILSTTFKDKFDKIVFAIYSKNEKFIRPFIDQFDS